MKTNHKLGLAAFAIWLIGLCPVIAWADDIDLFVGTSAGTSDYPNVLIILDNSSNWAAANQNWPTDAAPPVPCGNDCNKQGYYELKALRTVINSLPVDSTTGVVPINVGLMLFNNSTAARDGGYVRFAVQTLTGPRKAAFLSTIDTMIGNFNTETAASSVQYAAALFDAFKYFGGYTYPTLATKDQAPATPWPSYQSIPVFGTAFWGSNNADSNKPDMTAYSGSNYVPVSTTSCGKNFIIFIGNGFPAKDNVSSSDMGQVLEDLMNPSSPSSSISEFPVVSYSCSGTWSNSTSLPSGYTPGCSNSCTAPASSQSILYQCAKSSCSGNNQTVQQCTTIAASYAYPSSNAQYRYADEYANFLYKTDVSSATGQQNVVTYAIDVYKDQPSTDQTALLRNVATYGGGKYFAASDANALVNAMSQIFVEIQSVNSTFASASLPINATNRAQNENQVFIGMFRPDPNQNPRWFGNVKRYQLIADSAGNIQLGDMNGNVAINNNTGFITDCAVSWWTTDTPNAPGKTDNSGYWSVYNINPSAAGNCLTSTYSPYSDSPDGPRVEKGAVAEVVRKGNNPSGSSSTNTSPTWNAGGRTLYTASGTTLQAFNATNASVAPWDSASTNATRVNWLLGQDTQGENSATGPSTYTRASLHGDVVHSRPLPVNYASSGSTTSDVIIYYGANDGTLRAVDASNGMEKWAFVPPEFDPYLDRLRVQSPAVCYPNDPTYDATSQTCICKTTNPTYNAATGTCSGVIPTKRNYFFDGSIGIYQNADNSNIWIYPTMRRGGRMFYALDVTSVTSSTSSAPSIKWKFGCPDLGDDNSCVSNTASVSASAIGQTWSLPNVAFIKGYSTASPLIVMGGGYDACEDANTASPSCSGAKGNIVYVLNASTGSVVASFPTLRSVAADVALIDADFDGYVDYAYVADTGGNLYRINFASYNSSTGMFATLASNAWTITRIAYTQGAGRKFLFAPALFGGKGTVYVAIGSGDREHPLQSNYPYTTFSSSTGVWNRFYVYRECLPSPSPTSNSLTGGDDLDDDDLMHQSTATAPPACTASQTLANNCSTNKGWSIDLNNGAGEQTVTSAVISGGMVTFSTNRPIPAASGTCSTALGEARGYWLNLFNGSGGIATSNSASCGGLTSSTFVGGGLPPSPVVGTVSINGVPTSVVIGAVQKTGTASSPISPQKATPTNLPARKRVYSFTNGD